MTNSGWVRLVPDFHPEAVTWWFYRCFDDGFCFARGGRVRSAREARRSIDACWDESITEHRLALDRPYHELGAKGELLPLNLATSWSARGLSEQGKL